MASGIGMSKTDFSADVEKLVKEMFTPGYKFPNQDTDDDLKVNVSKHVSFGDIKDASRVEPQNEHVGGTIIGYICTVRKFFPGPYKLSVIHLYDDNDPLVIFHHEAVDPNLLAMQVIRLSEDYCEFHRDLRNSINRYDWCRWMYSADTECDGDGDCDEHHVIPHPDGKYKKASNAVVSFLHEEFKSTVASTVPLPNEGNHDFKQLIYFTKTEKAKQLSSFILKKKIQRSSTVKYLFSVQDDDGETISLGVDFTPFNNGDWVYGKAFEDSATRSYFALVLNGYLALFRQPWLKIYDEEAQKELNFTSIAKTELRFPMTEFMFNN